MTEMMTTTQFAGLELPTDGGSQFDLSGSQLAYGYGQGDYGMGYGEYGMVSVGLVLLK